MQRSKLVPAFSLSAIQSLCVRQWKSPLGPLLSMLCTYRTNWRFYMASHEWRRVHSVQRRNAMYTMSSGFTCLLSAVNWTVKTLCIPICRYILSISYRPVFAASVIFFSWYYYRCVWERAFDVVDHIISSIRIYNMKVFVYWCWRYW